MTDGFKVAEDALFRHVLRDRLRDLGEDAAWFAGSIEVCKTAVNRWLSGRNLPRRRYLPSIAACLGVAEQDLIAAFDRQESSTSYFKPSLPLVQVGDTFGMLTVAKTGLLRESTGGWAGAKRHKVAACEVRCECGQVKTVTVANLRSGGTNSCGCARWTKFRVKVHIQAGDVFGNLTVIEEIRKVYDSGKNERAAVCLCSCGTTKTILINQLISGDGTKSCGCLKRKAAISTISSVNEKYRNNTPYVGVYWTGRSYGYRLRNGQRHIQQKSGFDSAEAAAKARREALTPKRTVAATRSQHFAMPARAC